MAGKSIAKMLNGYRKKAQIFALKKVRYLTRSSIQKGLFDLRLWVHSGKLVKKSCQSISSKNAHGVSTNASSI